MGKAKIISFINQKGGVTKTTSCISVASAMARKGLKVLVCDLDQQCNASASLGVLEAEINAYSVLKGQCDLDIINVTDNLYLLPASNDLAAFDLEMSSEPGTEFLLKEALQPLKQVDVILIDCSPSLGLLTLNALTASDSYICPVLPNHLSVAGMSKLVEIADKVQRRLNPRLSLLGVLLSQFNSRKILHQDTASVIKAHFGDKLFRTVIRENISLAEAPSSGKSIFDYAPQSNGAIDYMNLTNEILEKLLQ
ncbi:ParA family protein [Carboxylicivirga marina]|uniref:ParA family protein n=1 Tax=Carboxylicivirga marina TaxID=2800988 RepID=A0ABS1HM16_9BACT|nr:ParA family protein [Carboxylicivirga marina]MBK3518724.1 ParA family protein [Carboxylicivirga marina]